MFFSPPHHFPWIAVRSAGNCPSVCQPPQQTPSALVSAPACSVFSLSIRNNCNTISTYLLSQFSTEIKVNELKNGVSKFSRRLWHAAFEFRTKTPKQLVDTGLLSKRLISYWAFVKEKKPHLPLTWKAEDKVFCSILAALNSGGVWKLSQRNQGRE